MRIAIALNSQILFKMRSASIIDRYYKLIGLLVIIACLVYLIFRIIDRINLVESNTSINNEIILEKLKSTAKLVIWEQDFKLYNIEKAERKYFDLDWLKFSESVITTANGRLGFHIDLADSVNTRVVITDKKVSVFAPLQLTYISMDPGTIQQIKDASIDPTLNIDKEEIIHRLNEIALREYLVPAISNAKKEPLTKQEQFLTKLAGRKVNITITSVPVINKELLQIKER
jgi:hypothetical protein